MIRLRHVALVNPPTPEFDRLADDVMVPFVPLEAVWPRGLDSSRRKAKGDASTGYTRFLEGDIVVPKITPTFQADRATIAAGLEGGVAAGTTELHVVRPGPRVVGRYVRYLLASRPFLHGGEAEMIGVAGQKRVPDAWLRDFPLWITDTTQQRAIADYLDAETARIDALIAKKRRLIELIRERVRADLLRLVLGDGVREGSASPSGIYRIVPAGWSETSLRHLGCDVQTGPFGSQLHAEEYVEGGWPVVNPLNLVSGEIEAVEHMTVSDEKRRELARHTLRPGDIVFGRRGEMGRAGLVTREHDGWLCGTGSLRLRLIGEFLIPDYLALLLGTAPARSYFQLASVGSTMDNLNSEIVLAFPALIPPRDTQSRIVAEVREMSGLGTRAGQHLEDQIDLLVEHRQALITAAVTGELSVPEVSA